MVRMALIGAVLAGAAPPAGAQACAELGQHYVMYTYKAGNRVAVHVREPDRRYLIALECNYDAAERGVVVDLGFGKLCAGAQAKVKGQACKVARIDAIEAIKVDPEGGAIVRRSAARK